MRIVALADTHGFHRQVKVPKGDILIFAGDVTMRGNRDELRDFAEWANALPHKHKIVIAGNHDFCFKKYREESEEIIAPMIYLEDNGAVVNDIWIWGTPWTPIFANWAFMRNEEELAKIFDLIPTVDILVSHGPPRNMLDRTRVNNENAGSISLWRVPSPKLHIFGHIHEGYGSYKDNDCQYVNASIMNFFYDTVNEPVVIDWEG
jgi:Icc-related predicted phosphoesterase